MTTYAPTIETAAPRKEPSYLEVAKGFWSWAGTLDHKRIGIMYLIGTTTAFVVGGALALLIRLHLWTPEGELFEPPVYNQIFSMHGIFMVFMFIIPAIPGAIANFALPLLLGAKDVALPRLNLASFYLWLAGTALAVWSIVTGAVDTGWTFYTPQSIETRQSVIAMGFGIFILGFSSIFTG